MSEPTAERATVLFEELEKKFPSQTLEQDRWYLIAVCHSLKLFPLPSRKVGELAATNCLSPIRSPPSLEAASRSLLEACTRISRRSHNTQPLNLDKSLSADWERHWSNVSRSLECANLLRPSSPLMPLRGQRTRITPFRGRCLFCT